MTSPRLRAVGPFAAAALVVLSACSSSPPPSGSDGNPGGHGDGSNPAVDGAPPPGLFPLHVSSDGRSLVTDDGKPFLLHGEAAWSLIAQLNASQVQQYLTDRHKRGVNVVLVNLIEHKFADKAPSNAAGIAPFRDQNDFTTVNEAYFAFADGVIDLAASLGIAVLMTPSYLGFEGTDQGWYDEMTRMARMTTAQCTTYGKFVGQRYASRHNILWVWGGDRTPTSDEPAERCMLAIRDAIHAAQPAALTTGHWKPETTSLAEPNFAAAIDIVGVYTYYPTQTMCGVARSAGKPAYLFETRYENEDDSNGKTPNGDPFHVRRQQWWGVLSCGAGEISGNSPIWEFASGWPNALGSPVSVAEQRLASIVQSVAWHTLKVDDAMITSGQGSADAWTQVLAARTSDQKQALIYIPEGGAPSITVDLSHMAGPVTALWQDPTADHSVAAGDGLTGNHLFKIPGPNSGQNHDWVLVLTVP